MLSFSPGYRMRSKNESKYLSSFHVDRVFFLFCVTICWTRDWCKLRKTMNINDLVVNKDNNKKTTNIKRNIWVIIVTATESVDFGLDERQSYLNWRKNKVKLELWHSTLRISFKSIYNLTNGNDNILCKS